MKTPPTHQKAKGWVEHPRRWFLAIGMLVTLLTIVTYDFVLALQTGDADTVLRDAALIIAGGIVGRSTAGGAQG